MLETACLPHGSSLPFRSYLLFEEVGNELMESATPGQELVGCAWRLAGVDLDAQLAQLTYDVAALNEVLFTPVHVHVVNLLVELVGIGEDSVVGGLHIEAEDGSAEGAQPCELVHVVEHDIERLVSAP